MTAVRTLVVLCPDWPVTAAGLSCTDPVVVVVANRVIACSVEARRFGIKIGDRRRSAQSLCPGVDVLTDDPARNARQFEPVVCTLETFCPDVQIMEPGRCALTTRGPSSYFGGDEALIAKVVLAIEAIVAPLGGSCSAGIADGLFAANLAAFHKVIVAPGNSAAFLAALSVDALNRPELASLLVRLGIKTLGAFGMLDKSAVAARFGPDGVLAHRLANGLDPSAVLPRPHTADLTAELRLDPPAQRVDMAAFATRALGVEFLAKLQDLGSTATIVAIEAQTENGQSQTRQWRFDDGLSESALADRLRWQLDGWLSVPNGTQPTAGIAFVRLSAIEVVSNNGRQMGLWGSANDADQRAGRGFARIQGQLGADSVCLAHIVEGRDPRERVQFSSWGQQLPKATNNAAPWPASVPCPAPTVVLEHPVVVDIVDIDGNSVSVSRRGTLSSAPVRLIGLQIQIVISSCAGPWTHDDLWWDKSLRRRRAFLQLLDDSGTGHLVFRENNQWWLDATYD